MARHFLSIPDLTRDEAYALLQRAKEMKDTGHRSELLTGKDVILLFEKASTRTRLSFEMAVRHLGGRTLFMTPAESQLGRNEPLKDTARVISRYAHAMVVRTFGQEKLVELAEYSDIPVINALSDAFHPCQIMSDMLTIYERTPELDTIRVAWVGDGNNMANSWINAAMYFPIELFMAFPEGHEPDRELLEVALQSGAKIFLTHDPHMAVDQADYVNTDVWASMGQEDEAEQRAAVFAPYQITENLLQRAKPDCKFMHCLPAHRGEEVTDEVMEGPRSIVFDQAENRLHMQKALLELVLGSEDDRVTTLEEALAKVKDQPGIPADILLKKRAL